MTICRKIKSLLGKNNEWHLVYDSLGIQHDTMTTTCFQGNPKAHQSKMIIFIIIVFFHRHMTRQAARDIMFVITASKHYEQLST